MSLPASRSQSKLHSVASILLKSRFSPVAKVLRTIVIAYLLGYTTTTTPRIASTCARYVSKRLKQLPTESPKNEDLIASERELVRRLVATLKGGLRFDGFAMVCVIILGGRKVLEPIFKKVGTSSEMSTFLASFISGFTGMSYWHQSRPDKRTVDLTLAATVRAIDVVVQRSLRSSKTKAALFMRKGADTFVFAVSCTIIMFAWFYTPDRLPNSYNDWIMRMAAMDERLLYALRLLRDRKLEYGVQGEYTSFLEPYARDLGYDEKMGNLVEFQPIPCCLVHEGYSESCEIHALWRWRRAFESALMIYLPINTLLLFRRVSKKAIQHAILSSLRSAAFLATFVSLTWYGVCLTRSRIGPRLFPSKSRNFWDNTTGPLVGCLLCGWSILIESPKRRGEMALYVAPRALATVLPETSQSQQHRRLESAAFAVSLAVLMTASKFGGKDGVRGFIGTTLSKLMDL